VTKKIFKQLLFLYFFFVPLEFFHPKNLEVEPHSGEVVVSLDSTRYFVLDYNHLSNLEIRRIFYYEYPDSLIIELHKILLGSQPYYNNYFKSSMTQQWQINEQLTSYLKLKNDSALKSELGIVGKVLGNAKNITAIILAILHVIKYRKRFY
jgi:hypothetical protein